MQYLNGSSWVLLKEFTEVESGKGSNALEKRPVVNEALAYAKKYKAKLVIAKLDRLARNVPFVSSQMEAKVPFVCADIPEANKLTIHLMAAMAQHECKMISDRTKAAPRPAKERGIKLGNPNLSIDNTARSQVAKDFTDNLRGTL